MLKFLKKFYVWAERVEFPISLVGMVIPAGTVTAVFGTLEGYDYSTRWLIFCFSWAALSVAAGVTHLVIRDILKTSAKGKLHYIGPDFMFTCDDGTRLNVQPRVMVQSMLDAPLYYEVRSFHAVANSNSVNAPGYDTAVVPLNKGVPHIIRYATIPNAVEDGDSFEGSYSFEINYGKSPTKLHHPLKMAFKYRAGPVLDCAGQPTVLYAVDAHFSDK